MKARHIKRRAYGRMADEIFIRRLLGRVVIRMVSEAVERAQKRIVESIFRQRERFLRDLVEAADAMLPVRVA